MSGYVYIFTNSAMPGLVKIGSTNINPHHRARQLQTTGVPAPFTVYGYVEVDKPIEVEKATHVSLSRFRYSKSREYFIIEPEEAVKILESVSGQYELKRREEAAEAARRTAEAARRNREEQDRKRQKQFEEELFSFLEMACEEAEEKVNIRFYKNLKEYSEILAWLLFLPWVCSFRKIEVFITISIVWALVGLTYRISSKIVKNKFAQLEKIVYSTMEELFGQTWREHKGKCVDKLYQKYIMDEKMRRAIAQYKH